VPHKAKEAILNTASGGPRHPFNAGRQYPGIMGEDFSESVGDHFSESGGDNISEWMGGFPRNQHIGTVADIKSESAASASSL